MFDEELFDSTACQKLEGFDTQTIFFPGCCLNTLAPELVDAALFWAWNQGIDLKKYEGCCGLPLLHHGKKGLYQKRQDALVRFFEEENCKNVIVACPNCFYVLRELAEERNLQLEIAPLPKVLHGFGVYTENQLLAEGTSAYVHVSCPDHGENIFANDIRGFLNDRGVKEKQSKCSEKVCCGVGKEFSHLDFNQQLKQAKKCSEKASEVGADSMIASCASCAFALTSSKSSVPIFHYLEFIFGIRVDWGDHT